MSMRESFEKFMKTKYIVTTETPWECYQAAYNLQQATIDRIMLEFCPGEMTNEQIDAWAKAQKRVSEFLIGIVRDENRLSDKTTMLKGR